MLGSLHVVVDGDLDGIVCSTEMPQMHGKTFGPDHLHGTDLSDREGYKVTIESLTSTFIYGRTSYTPCTPHVSARLQGDCVDTYFLHASAGWTVGMCGPSSSLELGVGVLA